VAPLTRVAIDIAGDLPWGRGNDNTPRGFSEQAALRRKQCDVMPKIQNLGIAKISQRRPLLGSIIIKHVSQAMGIPTKVKYY
jgi:hypothetical protein